jgi:hypothetical protein
MNKLEVILCPWVMQTFCRYDTQSVIHKRKKYKLDLINIKNATFLKYTLKIMKNKATCKEKIFTKHIPDKGLILRIYKKI